MGNGWKQVTRGVGAFFPFLGVCLVIGIGLLLYQNCGEVALKRASSVPPTLPSSDLFISVDGGEELIEFSLVNLTARAQGGVLEPDSDMDGIVDREDPNPRKRRSNSAGLLDGICRALGGPEHCSAASGCQEKQDSSPVHLLGLNGCDRQVLNLNFGFDADADLIPDFIEVLFGLSPVHANALDDTDHDGLINIEEIHQEQDPLDARQEEVTIQWTMDKVSLGQYHVHFDKIPLVETLDYRDPEAEEREVPLYHEKGENVFFVYYITQKDAGTSLKRTLWGFYQKQTVTDQGYSSGLFLSPSDQSFEKLGEMNVSK